MEAEEKKGYVNQLYLNLYCLRFTCGAECECNMLNNHENLAYGILTVCMWLAFMPKKSVKHVNFFEGQIGKILKDVWDVYY